MRTGTQEQWRGCIDQLISTSSTGVVFCCSSEKIDIFPERVTMKRTSKKRMVGSSGWQNIAQAELEIKILKEIRGKHPNIASLCFAQQTSKFLYLGFDIFIESNMSQKIMQSGCEECGIGMDYSSILNFTTECVSALSFLHGRNIVYKDLSPENIAVGIDGHIRLLNFGHAEILKDGYPSVNFFPEGDRKYMAPELLCRFPHGHEVDWWSLGVIIFEMMTKKPPYSSVEPDSGLWDPMYLNESLQIPTHMHHYYGSLIMDFLCALLQKNPRLRPTFTSIKEYEYLKQNSKIPGFDCRHQHSHCSDSDSEVPCKFTDSNRNYEFCSLSQKHENYSGEVNNTISNRKWNSFACDESQIDFTEASCNFLEDIDLKLIESDSAVSSESEFWLEDRLDVICQEEMSYADNFPAPHVLGFASFSTDFEPCFFY